MTWGENESYYLGDLHLLNQALLFKAILKVEFRELYLPPFFVYWLLAHVCLYWLLAPIGPIHCGVGSIGPIELPINRFGGRYVNWCQVLGTKDWVQSPWALV